MKKLLYSAFFLLTFTTSTFADHIMGGDITYTHISGEKYQVNVTMFRDCGECLLNGKGGGNTTKNCGGFDLYLYSVESTLCNRAFVDDISLTFQSYKSIINVCGSVKSKCSETPNFSYGIEAHYYTAVVDFSAYSEYKGCNFEFSIETPFRKDNLTNVTGSELYFFTYSEINPWVEHSSAEFNKSPTLLLNCGKEFSENIITGPADGDSISVSLVRPLRSRTSALTYRSEYTAGLPLKVWCGGDPDCKADISVSPFKGFYINPMSGLMAFTPIKCDEKAVVAYEVKKWVKDDAGNYQLVSKVRRDVQLTVTSLSSNNAPQFSQGTSDKLKACVGETRNLSIYANDDPTVTPTGTLPSDTVRFEVLNAPEGLTYKVKSTPDAPFNYLELTWSPQKANSGKKYYVTIRLIDNSCPVNASNEMVIELAANPTPEINTLVEKLQCGHLGFKETTGEGLKWQWNLKCLTSDWSGDLRKDTLTIKNPDTYTFTGTVTGANFCSASFDTTITFTQDDILVDIISPEALDHQSCLNDSIHLAAQISTNEEFSAGWITSDGLTKINGKKWSMSFSQYQELGDLQLWVETERNGLKCRDIKPVNINILPLPEIQSWQLKEVCFGSGDVNLMEGVTPANGEWYVKHKSQNTWSLAEDNSFSTTQWEFKHFDTEYLLEYRVTDDNTGCSAKQKSTIALKRLPQMQLFDLDVCATGDKISLKLMVERPYVYETGNYTWTGLDNLTDIIRDQTGDWLKIPNGITGDHRVVAVNKTSFGCENSDTAVIKLLENVKIEFVNPGTICKASGDIDLTELTQLNNRFGIWYSPDKPDWVNNGMLSRDACGQFRVGYIIDKFGCFDQKELALDVRCEPDFVIDIPDTVCKNLEFVPLNAQPLGGAWFGQGVRDKKLDLSMVSGDVLLTYAYADGPCKFETTHAMFIEESPTITIGSYPQSICDNEAIVIEGISFTYGKWQIIPGNGEYSPDLANNRIAYKPSKEEINEGAASFLFTVDGKGLCKTNEVRISTRINPTPVVSFSALDYEGCAPFEFKLRSKSENENVYLSDVDFTWNFGDPASGSDNISKLKDPSHLYTTQGTYDISLTAIHKQGCSFTSSLMDTVEVYPNPTAGFIMRPDGIISALNPEIYFTNLSSGSNLEYLWDFGDGSSRSDIDPTHIFPSDTGIYKVTLKVTNEYGCSDIFTDQVYVGPDIKLFIPNAFTPNKKGPDLTETFSVRGQNIQYVEVSIYNRWGEIMTEYSGLDQSWDGTSNGVPCMAGVYLYIIKATSVTGHAYEYQGTLTLIR